MSEPFNGSYMSEDEEGRRIRRGAVTGAMSGFVGMETVHFLIDANPDLLRWMSDGVVALACAAGGIAIDHAIGGYKARREITG